MVKRTPSATRGKTRGVQGGEAAKWSRLTHGAQVAAGIGGGAGASRGALVNAERAIAFAIELQGTAAANHASTDDDHVVAAAAVGGQGASWDSPRRSRGRRRRRRRSAVRCIAEQHVCLAGEYTQIIVRTPARSNKHGASWGRVRRVLYLTRLRPARAPRHASPLIGVTVTRSRATRATPPPRRAAPLRQLQWLPASPHDAARGRRQIACRHGSSSETWPRAAARPGSAYIYKIPLY
jgi:hypothetical protein